jgi:hypothetical protein
MAAATSQKAFELSLLLQTQQFLQQILLPQVLSTITNIRRF